MKTLVFICISLITVVYAATAKQIDFVRKDTTILGEQYSVYRVTCDDGSKKEISSWNQGTKWCIGTSKSTCGDSQLEIANKACGG